MILYRYCFRYHLLPIALEKFPSTFDLKNVENKKFFPHLYNKMVNLEAEPLSSLPPKSDYFYSSMNSTKEGNLINGMRSIKMMDSTSKKCSLYIVWRMLNSCPPDLSIFVSCGKKSVDSKFFSDAALWPALL